MAKWTNQDLENEFKRLNHKYFGGRLDVLYVKFEKIPGEYIGHTKAYRTMFRKGNDRFSITIDRKLQNMRTLWMGTLIHEMVHVEQKNKYDCGLGRTFNKRMKELAAAGAFDGVW